ncbi:aconitate hydratase B, partial [Enterobacter hormaechei subsp. steigerwaltii]|nr:aconitate hydratase B [Enterobacter hormaechei subsp. steigerwaltii]
ELLKSPPAGEGEFLVELLAHRVPPGVDDAAKVKASFLAAVAEGSASSPLISPEYATELLGTMLGGYNIHALIELLDDDKLAPIAAKGLKHTLLMFDSFHDVQE